MSEAMLIGGATNLVGGMANEIFFEGPARRRYNQESRAAIEARRAAEQDRIDRQNAKAKAEIERTYGAQQAVAYRLAHVHEMDAERQAANYDLVAQDHQRAAGAKAAQQVVSYTRSGALVAGSALGRVQQTKEEGEEAARRLRKASDHVKARGKRLSNVVRSSVIKRPFVPSMDAIPQPFVPAQSTFSPVGSFFAGMMPAAQNMMMGGLFGTGGGSQAMSAPTFGGANPYMSSFQSGGVYHPTLGVTTGAFDFAGDNRSRGTGWAY